MMSADNLWRSGMLRALLRLSPPVPFLFALVLQVVPGPSPLSARTAETAGEPAPAGTAHPACEPSAETRALLDELDVSEDCARDDACVHRKIEDTRRLVTERPDDLHLHLHLQSLVRHSYRGEDRWELVDGLRDRYRQRTQEHPESALALFLLSQMVRDEESKELGRRAVEADPGFPWGHLALATAWLQERNKEVVFPHFDRFLELCPGRAQEVLVRGRSLPDGELWAPRLPALRQALRADDSLQRQMSGFSSLWALEFQTYSPREHAAVRQRVREDLEILRRVDDPDLPGWWEVLGEGYEALGDPEAVGRFDEEVLEAAPCSSRAVGVRLKRWREHHGLEPMQESLARPEVLRASFEATGRWLEQCPDELRYSAMRFGVARRLAELSGESFLEEVERHLAVWEKNEHRYRSGTTPWGRTAEVLLDRGLEPRRAVGLAERELERTEQEIEETRREGTRDSLPEEMRLGTTRMDHYRLASHNTLLARARFAAGDTEGAREAIAATERSLAEIRTLEASHPEALHPPYHDRLRSELLEVLVEQARREERTADAFAYLRLAAQLQPNEKKEKELRERASGLWREMGGTDDGWRALTASENELQVAETDRQGTWQVWEQELPDFALEDLEGRRWTPKDLAGQAVLVNFWATWCGPCRLELPHVHELQQRLEDRPGMTAVTLNADFNPGLIRPFLEENGFRFPVLLATDFVIGELAGMGLPTTWIVDPSGVIRMRQRGYDPEHADTWVAEALRHLETVAASSEGSR